eukprot:CAMPEP_0171899842 /NCGR_PEP_ID=MMETSP0992-20121227/49464_1 /TAXON_ID=483369 /ORGANISM="non described non described, Strain CCMP2098" /LENGTH=51 /DNA_ID=CAMNT_0012528223 /DNA_START=9 /DNA_END=161 /DNA_ORIENTATION=-
MPSLHNDAASVWQPHPERWTGPQPVIPEMYCEKTAFRQAAAQQLAVNGAPG